MGYSALGPSFGRHWVRLKRGQVENTSGWVSLDPNTGQLPTGVGTLVQQDRRWSALRELAFPFSQTATLFLRTGPEIPYDALYSNPSTRQIRLTLDPVHTNALVKFFLELGNYYIDPVANNGNPSRKLARYQLVGSEAAFVAALPDTYPLTSGLQRLTAVRALLHTGAYLGPTIPPFSQCFRARAYDQSANPVAPIWPSTGVDTTCYGGSLRGVAWHADTSAPGYAASRGLQPKFLGLGGSLSTLVALFPSNGQGVESYFWCTPGIEIMTDDTTRFDAHMGAFSANTLLPTHYDDFLNYVAWSVIHTY